MPKRTDISSILIIGAGPIIIGQASEFDYSGTQACKALRAEGRQLFREAMRKIGLTTPKSRLANASALKKADREKYLAEATRIEALDEHPGDKKRMRAAFDMKWTGGENERRK